MLKKALCFIQFLKKEIISIIVILAIIIELATLVWLFGVVVSSMAPPQHLVSVELQESLLDTEDTETEMDCVSLEESLSCEYEMKQE